MQKLIWLVLISVLFSGCGMKKGMGVSSIDANVKPFGGYSGQDEALLKGK